MKVKQLMTEQVRTCAPGDTCADAATIMGELNVGFVPVVEGQKVVGVVTDRDIVLRAVARGGAGASAKLSEVMSKDVTSCTPDMDAHQCAALMGDKQIRRLPVVENGRLCGVISIGDLATVDIHVDEAGNALSSISEPAQPGTHGSV